MTATTDMATPEAVPPLSLARAQEHVSDVLVVVVSTGPEHFRRRVFLNLPSAERAARRAEKRGQAAQVVLCRLQPTPIDEGAA